jgi:hypothetical protein
LLKEIYCNTEHYLVAGKVVKPEEKGQYYGTGGRCDDNIRIDLTEIWWEVVN